MSKAKSIAIFIAAILVLLPGTAHAQDTFYGMKLLTQNTGWATRNGQLYWTNDFGRDWRKITPPGVFPLGPSEIADVFFLDTSNGWVLLRQSDRGGPYGDWRFYLASTENSGASWQTAPIKLPDWDVSQHTLGAGGTVDFVNPSHGWVDLSLVSSAAFNMGNIFATTDGGTTRHHAYAPVGFGWVKFISPEVGWAGGGPGGMQLAATRDGGRTWQRIHLAPPKDLPQDLGSPTWQPPEFANAHVAFLPASFGAWGVAVYASRDGGKTWRAAAMLTGKAGGSVIAMAIPDSVAVIPARSKGGNLSLRSIRLTGKAGLVAGAWPEGTDPLEQASFVDASDGWVSEQNSLGLPYNLHLIYATTDGGATWSDITPGPHMPRISRHAAR